MSNGTLAVSKIILVCSFAIMALTYYVGGIKDATVVWNWLGPLVGAVVMHYMIASDNGKKLTNRLRMIRR